MNFEELSDDEWMLVSTLVADEPPIRLNRRGRPRAEPRVVVNAVLWILTTGESWSRLPARYPSGPTCRRRFDEWHVSGTLLEIVLRLTGVGRNFVYVPEPAPPVTAAKQVTAVVEAEVEETAEDDGHPAVYWKSPEAWQAPAVDAVPAFAQTFANPIESMTRQLARAEHAEHVARARPERVTGSRARPATATALPPPARRAPGVGGTPQSVQVAEWRGFEMNLTVQPVRNRMYRAAVEILKDGKRVERSGLIGPPFQDRDSAKHFAFDWARKWIDHECRGTPAGAPAAAAVSGTLAPNGVVTRPVPASPGNVRLAPLQRYSASSALLPPVEARDANTGAGCSTAGCGTERRSVEPHFRPHVRNHIR
jgi:transposase